MFSQFRLRNDYSLSLVFHGATSRSAHDLFGLVSEVGEHGARMVELLKGVADVLYFFLQELAAYSEGSEEEFNNNAFFSPCYGKRNNE